MPCPTEKIVIFTASGNYCSKLKKIPRDISQDFTNQLLSSLFIDLDVASHLSELIHMQPLN